MKKIRCILIFIIAAKLPCSATILPADNAVLNYTQVMFEFDEKQGADTYILTIIPAKEGMMKKTRYVKSSLACLVTEDLEFNKNYRWYYEAFKKGKPVFRSVIYHFSIAKSILISNNRFRYNIIKKEPGKFQDNIVFIENIGVAINRSGQPVWYMPLDTGNAYKAPQYRNLAMTDDGTFTFLLADQAYEKTLGGDVIWKAPDDGAVAADGREHYHHDFAKQADGTYIACSYKWDTTVHYYHDTLISHVRYNTVIQYDIAGKVLWSWNEKDHVNKADIFSIYKTPDVELAGTHMNGFCYDRATNSFLFSFRDNSTVLRVDKATGKVLYALRGGENGPVEFHSQHSPVVLKDGSSLIYNNNNAGLSQNAGGKIIYPTILNVQIPVKNGTVKKIWEYECKMKEYPAGLIGKEGYASELPNKNILVCVGGANKIFEVSREKKIVWEMNCEEYNEKSGQWGGFNNYRAHYTSSLYPYYFTAQNVNGIKDITPGKLLEIKVNNDGSENDEYKIEVFSGGMLSSYSAIIKIPAQGTITKKIILSKIKSGNANQTTEYVLAKITSLSNPRLIKTITYTLK